MEKTIVVYNRDVAAEMLKRATFAGVELIGPGVDFNLDISFENVDPIREGEIGISLFLAKDKVELQLWPRVDIGLVLCHRTFDLASFYAALENWADTTWVSLSQAIMAGGSLHFKRLERGCVEMRLEFEKRFFTAEIKKKDAARFFK